MKKNIDPQILLGVLVGFIFGVVSVNLALGIKILTNN